jgi:V/A-type H+-transporting ATPase subunit G/H
LKSELLLRIKDAETGAKSRIAQAEAEAKTILADARRQAEALLAEGRAQADFAHSSRLEAARKDADAAGKKLAVKGQKDAETVRARFLAGSAGVAERALKVIESKL